MTGKKGRREESSHKGGEEGEISHKERNGGRNQPQGEERRSRFF